MLILGWYVDDVVKVRSGSGPGCRIGWAPDSRGPDSFSGRVKDASPRSCGSPSPTAGENQIAVTRHSQRASDGRWRG